MVHKIRILIAISTFCCLADLAKPGYGQQILAMPRMGGYSATADNTIGAGGVGRPSVSPYANLQMVDALGMVGGYQTLVQPFVYQRQATNVQQGSIQQLQRQVSTAQSTTTSARRPNQIMRDTGHQTHSMNYSHYYPTANMQ
jgi:hypothetical protein